MSVQLKRYLFSSNSLVNTDIKKDKEISIKAGGHTFIITKKKCKKGKYVVEVSALKR